MSEKNFKQTPEDMTISRQTRNAFATAILFTVASLINLIVSLRISLETQALISFADTVVVFLFFIMTIISATVIRKGEKRKGVVILLISFAITLAFRNAFTAGLGFLFGFLAITITPLMGLLTLKPKDFNRTLTMGLILSSFYLSFDILASTSPLASYRQLTENVETMVRATTILAITVSLIYLVALYLQRQYLLISPKITIVIIFFVVLPSVVLSVAGIRSLKTTLSPRLDDEMRIKATFLADDINVFLQSTKTIIKADSENPFFPEYLLSLKGERDLEHSALENKTLDSLRAIRRKDIANISSYAILDISGKNVLDTFLKNRGDNESDTDYFIQAIETRAPFVSDISRDSSNNLSIYFSAPIFHKTTGEIIGVLRAKYSISAIEAYIDNYIEIEGSGNKTVFAALLAEQNVSKQAIDPEDPTSVYIIAANSQDTDLNLMSITPLTTNVITPLQMNHILPVGSTAQLSLNVPYFDQRLRNRHNDPVFEAQAFPRENHAAIPLDVIATADIEEESLSWVIVVSQDLKNYNAYIVQQSNTNIFLAIVIAIIAAITAYYGGQSLIAPLIRLTNTANQVAQGNLEARADIDAEDEIGVLGNAFNSMADQIDTLVTTLESRIAERTQALQRSTHQLRAAVEVGKSAASLRNLDELLTQTTDLISAEFGFYHAGIFLIDPYGKYALLKAANSKGGRRMLARAHKLEVGAEGIVGYVTATGEARIALDVGHDAAYFNNPLLPDTRSEMALPLIAGGKIFGALDIQSTEGEAFTEADTVSLQVLADQVAVAIENARLFDEAQKALAIAQRAYGEQSQMGWKELIHQSTNYGYRSSADGNIYPLQAEADKKLEQAMQENQILLDKDDLVANIPIMVRGESIGAIQLSKPKHDRKWNQKDLDLARKLTAEISRAMDSARLFDETKKQADRERVVGEISNRMRENMNVESVIRLATEELYNLLDLEELTIHLNADERDEEKRK